MKQNVKLPSKPKPTLRKPAALFNRLRIKHALLDSYGQKNIYKFVIGLNLFLISLGSLYYTNDLVAKLEDRELRQVRLFAESLRYAINSDYDEDINGIMEMIREANTFYEIPAIYVDENNMATDNNNLSFPRNATLQDKERIIGENLAMMKEEHPPIPVVLGEDRTGYIYYSNSFLLTQLRYYPYIQLAGIFIIGFLAYLAFSSARKAEQNQVWVGLAKETAHQLGTPLSSLMAWTEYFRSDPNIDSSIAEEIEKDVQRLEMITTRFSNIGSIPTLKEEPVAEIVTEFHQVPATAGVVQSGFLYRRPVAGGADGTAQQESVRVGRGKYLQECRGRHERRGRNQDFAGTYVGSKRSRDRHQRQRQGNEQSQSGQDFSAGIQY